MVIERTRKTIWMGLFRVNDMNAKKSVVVTNAGRAVVVVLGNAIDVDVNKHDDGTSRPEDVCDSMEILLVLFVCFFFAYFLTPEFLLSFTKNIYFLCAKALSFYLSIPYFLTAIITTTNARARVQLTIS